ncbi:FixH family protein [Lunatibacter salilacus]|uniref:FixH family protein n=1 Tax=Lunatibacter salilacus TaxID=2483804 RepID=UPI00131C8030|nr:FixH family protein [Lunatibacter salilacus]
MDWGKGIVLVFVAFAAIMISMVTICMKKDDLHLVTQNYYEEEIKYQAHIDKVINANGLSYEALQFDNLQKSVSISLPVGAKGELHLFRPSDARLDQKLVVDVINEDTTVVDLAMLKSGYWLMKLTWSAEGKSYYQEKKITI